MVNVRFFAGSEDKACYLVGKRVEWASSEMVSGTLHYLS